MEHFIIEYLEHGPHLGKVSGLNPILRFEVVHHVLDEVDRSRPDDLMHVHSALEFTGTLLLLRSAVQQVVIDTKLNIIGGQSIAV